MAEAHDGHQDQALIRGLRAGSREAWTALYQRYSVDIWRNVARLVGPDAGAVADIVQESFLAAAGSARSFDSARGTLWAWMSGLAHHHVRAYWRKLERTRRFAPLSSVEEAAVQQLFDPAAQWEELFERRRLAELVRYILSQLPEDYAALLTGKYLDGRSIEELTLSHGGTPEGLKSKLARARREFRERFDRVKNDESSLISTPDV